jgi:hypothetical protein
MGCGASRNILGCGAQRPPSSATATVQRTTSPPPDENTEDGSPPRCDASSVREGGLKDVSVPNGSGRKAIGAFNQTPFGAEIRGSETDSLAPPPPPDTIETDTLAPPPPPDTIEENHLAPPSLPEKREKQSDSPQGSEPSELVRDVREHQPVIAVAEHGTSPKIKKLQEDLGFVDPSGRPSLRNPFDNLGRGGSTVDDLNVSLPQGWSVYWDQASCRPYYHHRESNQVRLELGALVARAELLKHSCICLSCVSHGTICIDLLVSSRCSSPRSLGEAKPLRPRWWQPRLTWSLPGRGRKDGDRPVSAGSESIAPRAPPRAPLAHTKAHSNGDSCAIEGITGLRAVRGSSCGMIVERREQGLFLCLPRVHLAHGPGTLSAIMGITIRHSGAGHDAQCDPLQK